MSLKGCLESVEEKQTFHNHCGSVCALVGTRGEGGWTVYVVTLEGVWLCHPSGYNQQKQQQQVTKMEYRE